ncbi:MAG: amidohydrolase family protein [Candidatus Bathyarchaeia archaeon]
MLIDCHVHSIGKETVDEIIGSMDQHSVDEAIIFAPYPGRFTEKGGINTEPTEYMQFSYSGVDEEAQRKSTKFISSLQADAPDRIIAFAWIEPRLRNAVQNVEEAVTKFECRGVKMIPDHWYPYDTEFFPLYEKIQELDVPILFHSGILWGFKDSSRFCRPCNYEVLVNFPRSRFALAHISWPWTDECIALFGRFRANLRGSLLGDERAEGMQMYIDTTPGTPKFYRREVFKKALAYGCGDYMIFGSDSSASNLQNARYVAEMDKGIIRELGYSDEVIEKIQSENIARYLKGE